ncbi:hypothetical protein GCM10020370_36910 [Paenibacillus hodogayensis]
MRWEWLERGHAFAQVHQMNVVIMQLICHKIALKNEIELWYFVWSVVLFQYISEGVDF